MDVGHLVRAAREARRWSRADLAAHSGVSRVMVEQVERGRRDPSLRTLERLLTAMGLRGELRVHRVRDTSEALLTPQERTEELERRFPLRLVTALLDGEVRFAVTGELALLMSGFGLPVTETVIVLSDDDDNLDRASVALRTVSAGPAAEEDLVVGYDDLYGMAYRSMALGPKEIRRQREGWWMCEESSRMRVELQDGDPQERAVLVTVELFEERLTVPVLPVHLVTQDDPALAAVVGSQAWTTPSWAAAACP